jgi:hypothetical protein
MGLFLAALAAVFAGRIRKAWITAGCILLSMATLAASALFIVSTTNEGPRRYLEGQHLDAVLYSVAQVTQGRGMLVDTINQYGLYPQFLEPLFKVVGLSVLSFTITMWLLVVIGFFCIGRLLWENIETRWLVPIAFLSVVYYSYFSSRTWMPDDSYLPYHPLRFLFPSVGLYLFDRYIRCPSPVAYFLSLAVASLAILWNPDSGVALFGAWISLLAYREFSSLTPGSALKGTLIHCLRASIVLIAAASAYSFFALFRYHAWRNWGLLTVNLPVFYRYGGMMLPMPPNHPWILLIALYILTLARAGRSLLDGEDSPRQQLMMVTTVLGTGLFIYYQGRSNDNNLTMVIWPGIVLLALYADELWSWRKRTEDRIALAAAYSAAYCLLLFLCFPIVTLPDAFRAVQRLVAYKINSVRANDSGPVRRDIKLMQRYSKPGQRVAILSTRGGVYHAESGTASVFTGPGINEMLWRSEVDSLQRQVDAMPNVPVFVELPGVFLGQFLRLPASMLSGLLRGRYVAEENLTTGGSIAVYLSAPAGSPLAASATPVFSEELERPRVAHLSEQPGGTLRGCGWQLRRPS